jgi:hypothetical protein
MITIQQNKYVISIGEPWDFNSPDGQGIINGVVVRILSATCLIFKANYILDFNGVLGNFFVLYPRYAKNNFNDLKNEVGYVTINGNILPEEYNESMNENYLKEISKFVIIGSIRISPPDIELQNKNDFLSNYELKADL